MKPLILELPVILETASDRAATAGRAGILICSGALLAAPKLGEGG